MAWGGEEEQLEEIAAGNPDAKNWQKEAEQIVEAMVRLQLVIPILNLIIFEDGKVLQGAYSRPQDAQCQLRSR